MPDANKQNTLETQIIHEVRAKKKLAPAKKQHTYYVSLR